MKGCRGVSFEKIVEFCNTKNLHYNVFSLQCIFLMQLGLLVMNLFEDEVEEPNSIQRRMNQISDFNQISESLDEITQAYTNKIKAIFYEKTKKKNCIRDLVLGWDARRKYKGKHENFDNLRFVPFQVVVVQDNDTFILQDYNGNAS